MPFIGVIEVRKNGAIYSRIEKLDVTKPSMPSLEATLWEPTGAVKADPKLTKDAQAPGVPKDVSKAPPKG
jgi:hypothetical protein